MKPLGVRIRIDFGPDRALGPGKIALLEAVQHAGSLSQAARELGMGYRRAWLLLQSLNELFESPVAIATKGGIDGGGVTLTPSGTALIQAYRRLESSIVAVATRDFAKFRSATTAPNATTPVRRLSPTGHARRGRTAG